MKFSNPVRQVQPSVTLELNAKALELKQQGRNVVFLGVGEPDFPTPQPICQAAKAAIDAQKGRYTPTSGIPELKQAICEYAHKLYDMDFSSNEVMASTGAKQALFNALFALVNPGDKVILPVPYWTSYPEMIRLCGGNILPIDTTSTSFRITTSSLEQAARRGGKILLLNSPANPSGVAYSKEELISIAQIVRQFDLVVISDDIYATILFDNRNFYSIVQQEGMRQRCIVINGVSKTFSMTGWRLGFAIAPPDIIAMMTKVQDHTTSCPNAIAQYAAVSALRLGPAYSKSWVATLERKRNLLCELISGIPHITFAKPQGAFYLYVNFSKYLNQSTGIKNTIELAQILLEKAEVATIPGEAFGTPGFLRLSFAAPTDTLQEGVRRIHNFVVDL